MDSKKAFILLYHSLGACLSPYSAFFKLKQFIPFGSGNPSGGAMYIFSCISTCRKAVLTSI